MGSERERAIHIESKAVAILVLNKKFHAVVIERAKVIHSSIIVDGAILVCLF